MIFTQKAIHLLFRSPPPPICNQRRLLSHVMAEDLQAILAMRMDLCRGEDVFPKN